MEPLPSWITRETLCLRKRTVKSHKRDSNYGFVWFFSFVLYINVVYWLLAYLNSSFIEESSSDMFWNISQFLEEYLAYYYYCPSIIQFLLWTSKNIWRVAVNVLGKPSLKKTIFLLTFVNKDFSPPPLIIDEKPLRFGDPVRGVTPPLYKSEK